MQNFRLRREGDPLLKDHIYGSKHTENQSNMLWSDLCDYDLKDYIRSNDNETAKYNLDINSCNEKSKLPSDCINRDNNLFTFLNLEFRTIYIRQIIS